MSSLPPLNVHTSLEPIAKDDEGNRIPKVRNILPDLTHIYEPPFNPAINLRKNLAKILTEREGLDNLSLESLRDEPDHVETPAPKEKPHAPHDDGGTKPFTAEDLMHMRADMVTTLMDAANEATGAVVLIDYLLTEQDPNWVPTRDAVAPGTLTTSTVSQYSMSLPASNPSWKSVNSQIIVGTKDKTMRRASDIFQAAADRAMKSVEKGAHYWENAIRLRESNWPLVAAPAREADRPVPRGVQRGDNYARDFRIFYGLENSPARFRKDALASVKDRVDDENPTLLDLKGQKKRLLITLATTDRKGQTFYGATTLPRRGLNEDGTTSEVHLLDQELSWAQAASLEEELYEEVLREAANLPSMSARISEKKISIDATVDYILTFEMVDVDAHLDTNASEDGTASSRNRSIASLVYNTLVILLVRSHRATAKMRAQRNDPATHGVGLPNQTPSLPLRPPPILGPVTSLLQYDSFVVRLQRILNGISFHLQAAGVPCEVDLTAVGDDIRSVLARSALVSGSDSGLAAAQTSSEVRPTLEASVHILMSEREALLRVNGEATLRVGLRHTIRMTFMSPAIMTLHLPQSTISILDEGQLDRFLLAEVSRCVLERLRDIGREAESGSSNPTNWMVDGLEGTLVGDRKNGRLQMKVMFDKSFALTAVAVKTSSDPANAKQVLRYPPPNEAPGVSLEEWIKQLL